jgi:hypothetical protein
MGMKLNCNYNAKKKVLMKTMVISGEWSGTKILVFALFSLLCLLTSNLHAATYSGGSGTSESPYRIATAQDLIDLGNTSADYGKYFILTADIDLAGQSFIQSPIAPDTSTSSDFQGIAFTGVFDGSNYSVRNLTIHGPDQDYVGLFGCIGSGGQIRNIGVVNADIQGNYSVGGLVGSNGDWSIVGGTLTACYVAGIVSGDDYVGGLTGANHHGTITTCYATGNVSGSNSVGGLAGGTDGTISTCYATGSVNGDKNIGGLVGGCYDGTITTCYATGIASGDDYVGGLVGQNFSSLTSCYATGMVSGVSNTGGLVGRDWSGSITACFWDTQTSDQTTSSGGMGKTTAEMKTLAAFTDAGWDFLGETANGTVDTWTITEGVSYPVFTNIEGQIQITQCKVIAGSKDNSDLISFSGIMDAKADDLSVAGFININVNSGDMVNPSTLTFPINSNTFKKGKFSGKNSNSSLKFDTKNGKMMLVAKNIDLTGLACPIIVTVQIGSYSAQAALDEAIVNGTRKACPVQLMMGVKDTLTVDLFKVKVGKTDNTDSFTARGTFTIDEDYDKSSPMVITLGTGTFTVPGGQFINKNDTESCKKTVSVEGPVVDVKLDFTRCTWTISVKNASIQETGNVAFGMNCFGISLEGLTTVNIN